MQNAYLGFRKVAGTVHSEGLPSLRNSKIINPTMTFLVRRIPLAICILWFVAFAVGPVRAQAPDQQEGVVYDYVFLIDKSGSMAEGSDPLFPQVQSSVKTMIAKMEDGWNLIILPFAGKIEDPQHYTDLNANKRDQAQQYIQELQANGSETAIWDSACAALSMMNDLAAGDPNHIHVQVLLLFTDGQDNASKKKQSDCMNQYTLQRGSQPYLYWLWNALRTEPPNGFDCAGCQASKLTDLPVIGLVTIQPPSVNVGNLFDKGVNSSPACLLTWYPDKQLIGKGIHLGEPRAQAGQLPPGVLLNVSVNPPGNDPRQFAVSASQICLKTELINYSSSDITPGMQTTHTFMVPLISADPNIMVVPNQISITFSLTPPPATFFIRSKAGQPIEFGNISRPMPGSQIETEADFEIAFNFPKPDSAATVSVSLDSSNPLTLAVPQNVGLGRNPDEQAETVQLTPLNNKLLLRLHLSDDVWSGLQPGKYSFQGTIHFSLTNAVLAPGSDIDESTGTIPFKFTLIQPRTPLKIMTPGDIKELSLGLLHPGPEQPIPLDLEWDASASGEEVVTATLELSESNPTQMLVPSEMGLRHDLNNEISQTIQLDRRNRQLFIVPALPDRAFRDYLPGVRHYTGRIVFSSELANIEGDVSQEKDGTRYIPITFAVQVTPPLWETVLVFLLASMLSIWIIYVLLVPRFPRGLVLSVNEESWELSQALPRTWTNTIELGHGEVAVTLSEEKLQSLQEEKLVMAKLRPTLGTSLIGQWLGRSKDASFRIMPVDADIQTAGAEILPRNEWRELIVEQPINVIDDARRWPIKLKYKPEDTDNLTLD